MPYVWENVVVTRSHDSKVRYVLKISVIIYLLNRYSISGGMKNGVFWDVTPCEDRHFGGK
jgi:hypothetical protein